MKPNPPPPPGVAKKHLKKAHVTGDDLDSVSDLRSKQLHCATMTCFAGIPLGFDEYFTTVAHPELRLTSGQYKKDVLEVFRFHQCALKGELASLDSRICLSVDKLYSHDFCPYLQLSAHYIDDKWLLKKHVLKFCRLPSQDLEALDKAVVSALKDWEIEGKIFSFTMEYVHYETRTIQTLKNCVQGKQKLPLEGKLFGVDCCAGLFKLMGDGADRSLKGIIHKVLDLGSWEYPPAWNLLAFTLQDALYMDDRGEFSEFSTQDVPSDEEWEQVRSVSDLLIGVYNVVKALFKTKFPTANLFLHKLQELREELLQETDGNAETMLERLDKYWDRMSLTLAIASVMDPRFKMRYFDYLSSLGEVSGNKLQTPFILEAIRSLYGDYDVHDEKREYPYASSTSSDSEDEEECDSVQVKGYIQFIESTNQSPPKSDLDRYLEDPVVPWSRDFNVLSWWRVEGGKYPTLSKMARDVLAIPMSVATSQEAFDDVTFVDPRISNLETDELKNVFVCVPTWAE